MYIDVEPNPNTDKSFSMIYRDVTPPREVFAIKYTLPGGTEEPVQVTGSAEPPPPQGSTARTSRNSSVTRTPARSPWQQ